MTKVLKQNKKKKKGKKKMSQAVKRLMLVLLIVVAVSVITVTTIVTYMLTNIVSSVNGELIVDLDDYIANQDKTSFIYGYDKNDKLVELFKLHGRENRVWMSIDKMPQDLIDAFVALEDKRYNDHKGVDWYRTIAVVVEYRFQQGGSTITQQLIKNLTGEDGRTFSRKYKEIVSALNLEKHYNKKTILEAYLNTLYLDQGCYGVKTASQEYFGKDVSQLNVAECASLAAITNAPYTYDPLINPENNRERQLLCLKNMYDQEYLSKEEYEEAKNYKLVFTNSKDYVPTKQNTEDSEDDVVIKKTSEISDYYVDYVIETVITDLAQKLNITRGDAERKVIYGGLKIYTAVNIEIQKIVNDVYTNRKSFSNTKTQSAITIMDYNGRIVAIAGGAGKKTTIRGLNRAANSPRQPGSSIKPLSIYAPAIEKGIIHYSSQIQNYGILVNGKRWPINYGGSPGKADSFVTVQYAVAQSLNTVAAQVCKRLTPQNCFDFMTKKLHITTLVEDGAQTDINFSSMSVGGMTKGVTTLEMAAAFATFGNGGVYYKPYCYTKVTNSDGSEVILEYKEKSERAMAEGTAVVMRKLLETVVSSGTGSGYGISGFKTFAKTGTTSDNYDRWFVGGTPYYVAAVWYGYDTNKEISASGNPAGKIFERIMDEAHEGLKKKSFKDSSEVVSRKYCAESGYLASDICTKVAYGYYRKSRMPSVCTQCGENLLTSTHESNNISNTSPKVTAPATLPTEPSTETSTAATNTTASPVISPPVE